MGQKSVRQFLYENARRAASDLQKCGLSLRNDKVDQEGLVKAVSAPEDILLIVAGGEAGRFSAFFPGWTGTNSSRAITREIKLCPGGA
ncbi:hypothetical protein [Desulfoscipio geothermicus]|uniref:Uncharacterized protein n=1 Tax=Desulfoscipio geothermicus DSM 3669 TaxID=1121426 RepID=A0A1I6DLM7_9FIRM|nr:hypothetical protein [Desulfoscipio geothermicus]SFR06350.1 hypothetical protein SAMN05660706_11346 [Desulfoscipio geothermicus DSM 3669]